MRDDQRSGDHCPIDGIFHSDQVISCRDCPEADDGRTGPCFEDFSGKAQDSVGIMTLARDDEFFTRGIGINFQIIVSYRQYRVGLSEGEMEDLRPAGITRVIGGRDHVVDFSSPGRWFDGGHIPATGEDHPGLIVHFVFRNSPVDGYAGKGAIGIDHESRNGEDLRCHRLFGCDGNF